MDESSRGLLALGRRLIELGYRFTTVTPATQQLVNARAGAELAQSLTDIFGWSRAFVASSVSNELFELMQAAGVCERVRGTELWRSTVRFTSLEGHLFAHSAFPTTARDAVFFGPDSHRFVRALARHAGQAGRVVDVGCGSGVGGIVLAARGVGKLPVLLADVNPDALRFSQVNAALAGVAAETVQSDVLRGVTQPFDLVISNPPYLLDDAQRTYRDGRGEYGEGLSCRVVQEAIARLRNSPRGGRLLLYTGAVIVQGADTFLGAIRRELSLPGVRYEYEELDPDVFGDELGRRAYASADRIAAVFLRLHVEGGT
ncbi:MAG TPA: class I SAM-dependent methyltransferase [Polyangiaceae bacterium]|nr:class I SAM-dependent methyltransferase [Polyangiaceae bacterium]